MVKPAQSNPTYYLSVFDYFVGLALKGLKYIYFLYLPKVVCDVNISNFLTFRIGNKKVHIVTLLCIKPYTLYA